MTDLVIRAVTPDHWNDLRTLFGDNGAYSNCWCTWWLLTGRGFDEATAGERRDLLCSKVRSGDQPGLLAYRDGTPVGWCAVGPRQWYARLNSPRARTYRRIDDAETWVITCFFIAKQHRGSGVATALLDAAIDHATDRGATIIEGYPIDRTVRARRAPDLFVGTLSMFQDAGFEEVSRVGDRPLVRRSTGSS
jgi:GNAT superfamily N-acetyltransferase